MAVNIWKSLVKFFGKLAIFAIGIGVSDMAWAHRDISYDSNLHYCVLEESGQGPVFAKKGRIGPCHDFSKEKLGGMFRFKLLFIKNLSGASFQGVKVKVLNLKNKVLEGADFSNSKIDSFVVLNAVIAYGTFKKVEFPSADFHGALAVGAHFEEANLHGSDFSMGRFEQANFEGAILSSTNLRNLECKSCVMKNVKAQQVQAQNAKFEGANFEGAEMKFGKLSNASFQGANLRNADLSSAELDGINFQNADLSGTILHTANLKGADLRLVKGEEIKWRFAKFDASTKLPFTQEEAVNQHGMVLIPDSP